jgi:hypothetical protein
MYQAYCNYLRTVVASGNLSGFKSSPAYGTILEHVTYDQGYLYLSAAVAKYGLSIADIAVFCAKNDRIGSPNTQNYEGMRTSPTSLRYVYHALLILDHCKTVGNTTPNIVEVGCGYGGLALAIDQFKTVFGIVPASYTMVDLDEPSALQKLYMSQNPTSFPVIFERAATYGYNVTGTDNFLISNYCFSEIPSSEQQGYLRVLFPKCSHGFITWNMVKMFDIGKSETVELESPLTCGVSPALNYYVRF